MLSTFLPTLTLLLTLATPILSSPKSNPEIDGRSERHGCLNDYEAKCLLDKWRNFFTNFNASIAEKSVTNGFQLFSESSNFNNPAADHLHLSLPQYPNKTAFIAGQSAPGSGAHNPGVTVDQLFPVLYTDHGCNSFTFRWSGNFFGPGSQPIAGIDFVVIEKDSYLIEKAYSEWNTGAFLAEAGCSFVGGACTTDHCVDAGCGKAPTTPRRNALEKREMDIGERMAVVPRGGGLWSGAKGGGVVKGN